MGDSSISVGNDKVIRCWDTATGEPLRTLRGQIGPGPEGMLFAAALSPDGQTLAVGGFLDKNGAVNVGNIRLIDLRTGELTRLLHGHENVINALAFSPDGTTLASGSADTTVRLWDVASGECRQVLRGHTNNVYSVAFSPDGRQVASSSDDHTARVWEAASGTLRFTLTGHSAEVRSLAWSPDGKTIATGSDDQTIRLWNTHNGRLLKTLPRQENRVTCLAFSPDSRRLVSGLLGGPGDPIVRLWSLPAGMMEREFTKHKNTLLAVAFSPDGQTVASADASGVIALWDAATGIERRQLAGMGARVVSVAWAPDGSRLAWGNQTNSQAFFNERGPLEYTFDLFAGQPGAEVATEERWQRAIADRHDQTLALSDDRSSLFIRTGGRETKINFQNNNHFLCYTFTPSGDVAAGSDYTLSLYDSTGKFMRQCVGHTGPVWAVAASSDGRYLASASGDQTVRIWPLDATGDTVAPLLTIFRGTDGAWVAWTSEGYYACSPGAERLIGWQVNRGIDKMADYYPAYQFRNTLYRPDVICRLLEAGSTAEAVRLADAGRKTATDPTLTAATIQQFAPPKVELLEPAEGAVTAEAVTVCARVTDPNGRAVTGVTLLVNGRKTAGRALAIAPGQQPADERRWEVTLLPGENTLSVLAVNDAGAESVPVSVTVTYRPAQVVAAGDDSEKPALYLLAIGVSHYANDQYTLQFPAKDAHDFAAVYQAQQGKLFRQVTCKLLTDADAGKENIEDALDWLSKAVTQRDWAMVFVAGHGVTDSLNQYYFAPYNINLDHLKSTGVEWSDFRTTLANLPGKVFLVMDTCHAAGVTGDTGERARGADAYTDLLRDAMADEAGLITFASCMPRETSLEDAKWNNGAFTLALVEALSGKADTQHNGIITISEVDAYVAERVKELTGGKQHPTTTHPSTIRSSLPMAVD